MRPAREAVWDGSSALIRIPWRPAGNHRARGNRGPPALCGSALNDVDATHHPVTGSSTALACSSHEEEVPLVIRQNSSVPRWSSPRASRTWSRAPAGCGASRDPAWRRGFLHHLLMPALEGAVALAHCQHPTAAVSQNLHSMWCGLTMTFSRRGHRATGALRFRGGARNARSSWTAPSPAAYPGRLRPPRPHHDRVPSSLAISRFPNSPPCRTAGMVATCFRMSGLAKTVSQISMLLGVGPMNTMCCSSQGRAKCVLSQKP